MAVRGAVLVAFLVPKDSARRKRPGCGAATAVTTRLPNVMGLFDGLPKLRDRLRGTADGAASSVLVELAAAPQAETVPAAEESTNTEGPAASRACVGAVPGPGLASAAVGVAPAFRRRPVKLNRRLSIFCPAPADRTDCCRSCDATTCPCSCGLANGNFRPTF